MASESVSALRGARRSVVPGDPLRVAPQEELIAPRRYFATASSASDRCRLFTMSRHGGPRNGAGHPSLAEDEIRVSRQEAASREGTARLSAARIEVERSPHPAAPPRSIRVNSEARERLSAPRRPFEALVGSLDRFKLS